MINPAAAQIKYVVGDIAYYYGSQELLDLALEGRKFSYQHVLQQAQRGHRWDTKMMQMANFAVSLKTNEFIKCRFCLDEVLDFAFKPQDMTPDGHRP